MEGVLLIRIEEQDDDSKLNGSFGMNFHAEVLELGELPDYEIAEIRLSASLPTELNYGEIYYKMYDHWNEIQNKNKFKKYKVNYLNTKTQYNF